MIQEASMRAKQFCVLTTTELGEDLVPVYAFKPLAGALGCCPF